MTRVHLERKKDCGRCRRSSCAEKIQVLILSCTDLFSFYLLFFLVNNFAAVCDKKIYIGFFFSDFQ